MSKSGNAYIAATQGHQFTLYAACRAKGIPLSEEQERFQAYLEKTYPAVVEPEFFPDLDENEPEDHTAEDAEYDWKRDKEE